MNQQTSPPDCFSAGGTLPYDSPSYVKRPADDELLKQLEASTFCYVLTARQMGKSSLMIRISTQLRSQGVKTAIIDLTRIGLHDITVDQWYLGLLSQLQDHLPFTEEPITWWQTHAELSPAHRFTNFLRDVILTEIAQPIVIFIDEIDLTLHFEFRDDFFAAIRSMYNSRAQEDKNEFNRLTFVLLGVTTPTDLIKNPVRSPFNIGSRILLSDFSKKDTLVLQDCLEKKFPNQGQVIFDHIYRWTNGHPYLTQKLCFGVVQKPNGQWSDERVIDAWVKEQFQKNGSEKDDNIKWVEDFILKHEQRDELLELYKKVCQEGKVPDDGQSIIHNQLKLSGLVKEKNGELTPRNRIYELLFDLEWVEQKSPSTATEHKPKFPLPVRFTRLMRLLATLMVLLVSSESVRIDSSSPTPTPSITSPAIPASATSVPSAVAENKTSTPTVTASQTATGTAKATETATVAPSETATPTVALSATSELPAVTESETSTLTVTPSETATPTVRPTETATPTVTPSEIATSTVTPSEIATPTLAPSEIATPTLAPSEIVTSPVTPSEIATIIPSETQVSPTATFTLVVATDTPVSPTVPPPTTPPEPTPTSPEPSVPPTATLDERTASSPTPTPVPFTPSPTLTPSSTPVTPTSTPSQPTSRATYPSPVLLAPADVSSISQPTLLQWSWSGALQEDEYFDVRVWGEGESAWGVAWTKDTSYLFDPTTKGGDYLWTIVVIRGRDGTMLEELSEAPPSRNFHITTGEGGSGGGSGEDKPAPSEDKPDPSG
jgi:hypothetical protein